MTIGGHALVAASSAITTVQFLYATQPKGWVLRLIDREPIVMFSALLTGLGIAMPCVIVSARKSLGLSTSQYDGYTAPKDA
eukprot:CAMPEP_0198656178 /NCGR_PEP_ID=MMETSP1467-20131203/8829_1 /TAXON_ID=1462469 /ORGANISM="unid. sp., Strain CCMP2135" /LENGTH=80 /DNA_ID=CAMNT_0044392195 /DNA_START=37 /DNA_END=279 /DNA_ORIENTATION=-